MKLMENLCRCILYTFDNLFGLNEKKSTRSI